MLIRILLLALLTVSGCAHSWTRADTAAEATTLLYLAADYQQTRGIVADCRESNVIIGLCGERVQPAVYFPAVAVVHVILARYLTPNARHALQALTVGAQTKAIVHNWNGGYRFW